MSNSTILPRARQIKTVTATHSCGHGKSLTAVAAFLPRAVAETEATPCAFCAAQARVRASCDRLTKSLEGDARAQRERVLRDRALLWG